MQYFNTITFLKVVRNIDIHFFYKSSYFKLSPFYNAMKIVPVHCSLWKKRMKNIL